MGKLLQTHETISYSSSFEVYSFDTSIWEKVNYYFYEGELDQRHQISTPIIKGFPWPSQIQRFAFIHLEATECSLNKQADICICIIANVLRSGFTKP